jgi:hypothetical protein
MQSLKGVRGRLNKRSRVTSASSGSFFIRSLTENSSPSPGRCRKRVRKSTQLSQFKVYENETLTKNSPNLDA